MSKLAKHREQPADAVQLAAGLAHLHHKSQSPTGKFGFHVKTYHGIIPQFVDRWEDSWAVLFGRLLEHFVDLAKHAFQWPEFDIVSQLTLDKVAPRLLLPL